MKKNYLLIIVSSIALIYLAYIHGGTNTQLLIMIFTIFGLLCLVFISKTYQDLIDATTKQKEMAILYEKTVKILRNTKTRELITAKQQIRDEIKAENIELLHIKQYCLSLENQTKIQSEEIDNLKLVIKSKDIEMAQLQTRLTGCVIALKKAKRKITSLDKTLSQDCSIDR